MFVCEKVNRIGVVRVQVIAKTKGKTKLVKTIGATNAGIYGNLVKQGHQFIASFVSP